MDFVNSVSDVTKQVERDGLENMNMQVGWTQRLEIAQEE